MSGNSLGTLFRLTTFGESHGPGLGGIVDGCPAGIQLDEALIQKALDRRRPGQGDGTTPRREKDRVSLLSGVFEGLTTGTPIGFVIANTDQRSRDYAAIKDIYRPGHGDYTYAAKYGVRDYRGGGRSSGRETVSRVVAGAIAQQILALEGIQVWAYTVELGGLPEQGLGAEQVVMEGLDDRPLFAANPAMIPIWEACIRTARQQGDTLGGIVEIRATGVPAGLGEPVFDKLDARLAQAVMSVGAVKGIAIGSGFEAARLTGSIHNDPLTAYGFLSNHAGGILAGISSGQDIVLRAAVKPIPSIAREQRTINRQGDEQTITLVGRHDVCAIPRIVPVLQAMTALTLVDMLLMQRARK